jgi:hypothetical protein
MRTPTALWLSRIASVAAPAQRLRGGRQPAAGPIALPRPALVTVQSFPVTVESFEEGLKRLEALLEVVSQLPVREPAYQFAQLVYGITSEYRGLGLDLRNRCRTRCSSSDRATLQAWLTGVGPGAVVSNGTLAGNWPRGFAGPSLWWWRGSCHKPNAAWAAVAATGPPPCGFKVQLKM